MNEVGSYKAFNIVAEQEVGTDVHEREIKGARKVWEAWFSWVRGEVALK